MGFYVCVVGLLLLVHKLKEWLTVQRSQQVLQGKAGAYALPEGIQCLWFRCQGNKMGPGSYLGGLKLGSHEW